MCLFFPSVSGVCFPRESLGFLFLFSLVVCFPSEFLRLFSLVCLGFLSLGCIVFFPLGVSGLSP